MYISLIDHLRLKFKTGINDSTTKIGTQDHLKVHLTLFTSYYKNYFL